MNISNRPHRLHTKNDFLGALILPLLFWAAPVFAAVIGTNPPVPPLSLERIDALPSQERAGWKTYVRESAAQRRRDQSFFRNEMRAHGLTNSTVPPAGHSARSMPLDRESGWYGGEVARNIADHVVSFQTPAGGWSKNLDMTRHARAPGEMFGGENVSHYPSAGDFDEPREVSWNYIGTIDNDATTTELRFLAKVIAATDKKSGAKYRASVLRGVDYLLAAQFPNGGWPQVWPLQGGYHDAITINDDALLNVLVLLRDVSEGAEEFEFVPEKYRTRAGKGFRRGLACLLAVQVRADHHLTIWCQQNEALTLQPASARNYEMPALSTGESANILMFLMQIKNPGPEITAAVLGAAAWFEKNKLMNVAFKNTGADGRHLIAAPGSGPMWARYYQIGSDKPIFGDRDKTIHDSVEEISFERRQGYSWYSDSPKRALEHYARWSQAHPVAP